MFDCSLSQSRLYFQLLQLLLIIPMWIKETRRDVEKLRASYGGFWGVESNVLRDYPEIDEAESAKTVGENWKTLMDDFGSLEDRLLKRIEAKTNEVRGLRDGVCDVRLLNVNTLLEASKTTSMNRYIIIFTVLTIFYLPLGFVTAVFSIDILTNQDLSSLKGQYAASTVVVSILTYLVAGGLMMFVDRREIKAYI
ncbi:uncharacterized protein THITE_2024308, partial [Thermothielavioides terrestris NRRL 8126]